MFVVEDTMKLSLCWGGITPEITNRSRAVNCKS